MHMGLVPLYGNPVGAASDVASNILTYEKERLLLGFHNQMVGSQFAQKGNTPTNKGDSVRWHKKLKLARVTSAWDSEAGDITPKAVYMTSWVKQATEWAQGASVSRKLQLTAKHLGGWNEIVDLVSTQMAESLDYQMMLLLGQGGYRMRADGDTTFEVNATATSDGAAGGTTFISSTLTQADDFWNGGYIIITDVTGYEAARGALGQAKIITDFDNGTTKATFAAFLDGDGTAVKLITGVVAHLCVGTNITATDVITTSVFSRGVRQLKRNLAIRFNDNLVTKGMLAHKETQNLPPPGGGGAYWVCILNTDHEYDFYQDVTWVDAAKNQDKESLVNGYQNKWMGCKIYGITYPFREDVDGTANQSSGVVQPIHFLGQEAYGISPIAAPGAKGDFGVILNLNTPEHFGDHTQRQSSATWQLYAAWTMLNSLWNVTILGGATA